MILLFEACGMFMSSIIGGVLWSRWSIHNSAGHAVRAANWDALIYLSGGIAIVLTSSSHILVFPSAAGGWLGTYLSVRKAAK